MEGGSEEDGEGGRGKEELREGKEGSRAEREIGRREGGKG